ncbi:DUF397 domain-containing protein [Actinomadura fibrosa]|uniref:DUF397 domain-containing protein n=1 Tax=Actinomadura fibrosa TaxID=111802 RepID=A0ABW2XPU2_9ACTN|nr:DUF397 domain-containing protein [Actinomadura fibrosa]
MSICWRKSSHSGGANDEHCVEVGRFARAIAVRDSKDPGGGHLIMSAAEFAALVVRAKHERRGDHAR